MRILALESSCDESAVAVFDAARGLLAHALFSQIELHRVYGGVVPELASRDHVRKLLPLVRTTLADADTLPADLAAVAYTAATLPIETGLSADVLRSRLRRREATRVRFVGEQPGPAALIDP